MGVDEFYLYLSQLAESRVEGKEMKLPKNPFSMKTDKDEETLQMEELQKLQAALDAKDVEMSALATQFSELTAQMESLQATLGEKEAALSEALALAQASEEQAALQAKEAKLKDRQASLFAAGLSEEDAKSQAASLEALDDATFETVRAGFAKQSAAVQGSDLFQQQSAAATEAVVENTKTAAEAAVEATRKAMKDRGI
jgi:ribosomal protein L16 Arg81 hydroxylase